MKRGILPARGGFSRRFSLQHHSAIAIIRTREKTMLVNCAAYQDGRKIADLKPDEISDYVSRGDCFVWVALSQPGPGELAVMQHEFDLHPLAVEDSQHGHQRPKIEEYEDSLFVVIQTVEIEANELHLGEVDIFIGTNY